MEDFYPFRSEDIPELVKLARDLLSQDDCEKKDKNYRRKNAISFLLPLVIDLLDDVERSRALKNTFEKEYDGSRRAKISDGFWKIVRAYLKENNGTGNLLRITEMLRSNGHKWIAKDLEKFFPQYSLLASSQVNGNVNVYSLSRDFLQAGKKDIAGESVWNANSVEQALQNSIILEEIFKKLQLQDQKLFRVVSPTWMEETLSFWRRNARLLIHAAPATGLGYYVGISMESFLALWENKKPFEKEMNARGKEKQRFRAIEDAENYKLQDRPFRSCDIQYFHGTNLLCSGKTENKFWKLCGPHIQDLGIRHATFNTKTCLRLLQICPNLERLDISHSDILKTGNGKAKISQPKSMKIAENLHTLVVGHKDKEFLRSILFNCPNLKALDLHADADRIGALLSPACNGEFIKLKKLVVWSFKTSDYLPLRQYTEMLARKKFDSLEYFELRTNLSDARTPPFNLYAALAQASKNLKTLKLQLSLSRGEDEFTCESFMDLSPFAFSNLTELKLDLHDFHNTFEDDSNFDNKFDFGTLKGMPMLEKLEINAISHQEALRNAGTRDWVFEGDRNRYLPTGVTVDYQYSEEDPILCSKLKEFTFVGWSLNEEDVRLLSGWFPHLTHVEAEVSPEALPVFEENWQRLEKLVIRTEKLISLGKLRQLKEKKKYLRIFQRIITTRRWICHDLLELKEHNGTLFFQIDK